MKFPNRVKKVVAKIPKHYELKMKEINLNFFMDKYEFVKKRYEVVFNEL